MVAKSKLNQLSQEFAKHRAGYLKALAAFSEVRSRPAIPDYEVRNAFCEVDYHVKHLLACHRLGATTIHRFQEGNVISQLAFLEIKPVFRPEWQIVFAEMQAELANLVDHDTTDLPEMTEGDPASRTLYVGGVDRVSEGEGEMDFDIPEASLTDQVDEEVEFITRRLCEDCLRAS